MLVAIVTPLYPRPDDPHCGWPVYQTIEALQRYVDLKVICPQPSYQAGNGSVHASWSEHKPSITPTRFSYPAVRMLSRPFNGASCAKYLYPILRDMRPDLILNYWLYPEGYGAVEAGHKLGLPVIVESLGSDLRYIQDPFTRMMVGRTIRRADFVLTVSEELRQCAIRAGAEPGRTRAILNGFDGRLFHYRDQKEARRELQLGQELELIVYVGRFVKPKGLMELCEAFAGLASERPQARLAWIGYGPLESEMMAFLRTHGVENRVLTPGRQSSRQVAQWLQAADLFCLPSYSEGCPNVVVEAIGCGCAVVSTTVGGIPELVDPACGILVPPQDARSLLRALREGLTRVWDRPATAARKPDTEARWMVERLSGYEGVELVMGEHEAASALAILAGLASRDAAVLAATLSTNSRRPIMELTARQPRIAADGVHSANQFASGFLA